MTTVVIRILGPCACPCCGWDDDGELRIVDWYAELYPPIPCPRDHFAVWGDDPEQHSPHGLDLCQLCDEPLSPETVRPRR